MSIKTPLPKISIEKVKKLYPTVVRVEEYYTTELKWMAILPNGKKVYDPSLYHANTLQEEQDRIEDVVKQCIEAGASIVQFKCTDEQGHRVYVDYKVHELMPSGTLLNQQQTEK